MKNKMSENSGVLRAALASHWQTLHPGLQHTLIGDLVLSNQFDALVGTDQRGNLFPLGAKSWTTNEDFTIYEFRIDRSRRFSDGSYLTSSDYKKSWESSAGLDAKSSNNSLLDVLYKISGYENFSKTGDFSGVKVLNEDTLAVHFKSSFRMALDHLAGIRFAAHKQGENGAYLGTGHFVIKNVAKNKLLLEPNSFCSSLPRYSATIKYVESDKIFAKLQAGEIDVIPYIAGNLVGTAIAEDPGLEVIPGQDALHLSLGLNRLPGRFFSRKSFRQAFQKIVFDLFKKTKELSNGFLFLFDPQIYLDGQGGRLTETELSHAIISSKPSLKAFRVRNKEHPLKVIGYAPGREILKILGQTELHFAYDSGIVEHQNYLEILYKTSAADVVISSFSIANGDPDGIYHRLGRHGAILSPMNYSDSVNALLEEGRKIVDVSKLDQFYKNVSKEVLEDVPFIHLGFAKAVAIIRKDRIHFNSLTLRRNEGHLDVFELK